MTKTAFLNFWNCLSNAYSSKISADTRLLLLYGEEASCVPDSKSDKLLKAILKECEFFPKLGKFSEICSHYREEKRPRGNVVNKAYCDYCRNSGLIMDELHDDRTMAFACPKCEVGRSLKTPYISYYSDKYGDEGLEEVRQAVLKFRAEIGDPKEYFFKKISEWSDRMEKLKSK